ncbi:MAG: porphobilinogen synthase [Pseudonocardiaceae bacterium]
MTTGFRPPQPVLRPRRLRRTPALRRLAAETHVRPEDLVLPVFVKEDIPEPMPIPSLPRVLQHTRDSLRKAALDAVTAGVGGLMLFAVPAHRDPLGSAAVDPKGILNDAVRDVVAEVGNASVVMADLCLDEFTDHGHCGVLGSPDEWGEHTVDNDATLARYAEMAVVLAEAGAHVLGPSGMMDGQVTAIRSALDHAGHTNVALLAYAAKYASAFYGPFRDAVDSQLTGDRNTYQMNPANAIEADREVALDVAEGADLVMVKPAMSYLDIVRRAAELAPVPVAAYQVSGEYAMVEAAAARGWLDRDRAIVETLTSIRRAGASVILSYWATEAAERLR